MFKGKKMAGHMGQTRVTTQNLEIVRIDNDRGLVLVKGAVPGSKGAWVTVKDAVKKALPEGVIFPAATRAQIKEVEAAVEEAEEAVIAQEQAAIEAAQQAEAEASAKAREEVADEGKE